MRGQPNIEGIETVKQEVDELNSHGLIYCIFEISLKPSVSIKTVATKQNPNKDFPSTLIPETTLMEIFEECRAQITPANPYFIVYDFGYYNDQGNFRKLQILVSYTPDSADLRVKFAMAAHTMDLSNCLKIPMIIEIHDFTDLSYNHIKTNCNIYQRNK